MRQRIMVSTLWLWWQSWLLASQRHYYLPPRTGIRSHGTAGSSGPQGPQPAWWESWLHLGVPWTMVIPASLEVGEWHLSPGLHTYLLITNTRCYWKAPLSHLLLSQPLLTIKSMYTPTQYKDTQRGVTLYLDSLCHTHTDHAPLSATIPGQVSSSSTPPDFFFFFF